jgi:hypothetical protein
MKRLINYLTVLIAAAIITGGFTLNGTAKELEVPDITPADFSSPQDNDYLPMALGITYEYQAETEDELIVNQITNTFATKNVMGIDCVVVYDVEWIYIEELDEWFMTEETDDWLAWDNDGNVWYFGEETVEYIYDDDWNFLGTSTEGSWEAGADGAEPGILMLADPKPGFSYQQEYYEDEAEDMGKVLRLNSAVEIEFGEFKDCLVTKEWTALSPGEVEHKYYAPGIGLVFIEELKEKTVLVELVNID